MTQLIATSSPRPVVVPVSSTFVKNYQGSCKEKMANQMRAHQYTLAYLNKRRSTSHLPSKGTEATISDKNVSITPATVIAPAIVPLKREHRLTTVIAPAIVPLKREHRLTIAEINSATRASTSEGNASFTMLAQILSLNDKWLIIYCLICFGHVSEWKHRSICKTCFGIVHPTTRLSLTMEVNTKVETLISLKEEDGDQHVFGVLYEISLRQMVFQVRTSTEIWGNQPPIYNVVRLNRRCGAWTAYYVDQLFNEECNHEEEQ
ncbi:uncharacterized protein LOC113281831 isoform X2 [Papaver somniferum]|uniref:uncharacterized protein LOC113281831 isoform X2 n=1 Tax=Papaver somniferum TaxID=3469 RepID=UPI000E6F85E1|nr:uncharacterized protein LOC113281831 isoform X2 [Papaver somniferum]